MESPEAFFTFKVDPSWEAEHPQHVQAKEVVEADNAAYEAQQELEKLFDVGSSLLEETELFDLFLDEVYKRRLRGTH